MKKMTMTTRVQSFYAKIAARYGIDPKDENAVNVFFDSGVDALPMTERFKVITELYNYDGKSNFDEN